jgi:hypothetical protein
MKTCYLDTDESGQVTLGVAGIFLSGKANVKNLVSSCSALDHRVAQAITQVVDVEHSGEHGLAEAVEKTAEARASLLVEGEAVAAKEFQSSISLDDGLHVYGMKHTLAAVSSGAARTVIVLNSFANGTPSPASHEGTTLKDHLLGLCADMRTECIVVRTVGSPAHQLCLDYGGICALLRWAFFCEEEEDGSEGAGGDAVERLVPPNARALSDSAAYTLPHEEAGLAGDPVQKGQGASGNDSEPVSIGGGSVSGELKASAPQGASRPQLSAATLSWEDLAGDEPESAGCHPEHAPTTALWQGRTDTFLNPAATPFIPSAETLPHSV